MGPAGSRRAAQVMRNALVADAEEVAALQIASFRAVYRSELTAEFLARLDCASRAAEWRHRIEKGEVPVLLVERDQELMGFCAHGWSHDEDAGPGTWEITNLHIAPDLRRGGIGTALFDRAVAIAAQAGARRLTLWVVSTNQPARRFYEKKGMRLDEHAHKQYELGPGGILDIVRYSMNVTAP